MGRIPDFESQEMLQDLGFNPGKPDGDWGRLSEAAYQDWLSSKIKAVKSDEPPWLVEARRLLGTKEISGPTHNPRIMGWASKLGISYQSDETPWCGLFVAHCMSLVSDTQPTNPLGSRQWAKYGRRLDKPIPGSILVFWRGSPRGWKGHVGFYVSESAGHYHVLGGNQSNAVTITKVSKRRLLDVRWPESYPVQGEPVLAQREGAVSINEA
ncbi:TIGR02594 family protein [Pseudovibrio sp. POLY-S9]|uniref:NlpC/P60 family protein n=1 Tax=Pseudovibrio sp. POLY-S9 TaxID=1576596 RepID=UPI00070C6A48|nr:TIGR02594 family protein [Pseudovibrio sp. POLY-S9]